MKTIFCMLVPLCLYAGGLAQPISTPAQGLQPGDEVPAVSIPVLNNYPKRSTTFSAFQKELTIIDFWATWCGSCVESFPKMHALQSKFAGRLQLLMVNGSPDDNAKKVVAFFERRKTRTGNAFTLPYVVSDSVFTALFPHQAIPHCVWIGNNGKVIAITESSEVNETNIAAILKGEPLSLAMKNDALLFNANDELLAADTREEDVLYRSLILPGNKALGSTIFYASAGSGKIKLFRVLNYRLLSLYQMANPAAFRKNIGSLVIDSAVAALFTPVAGKPEALFTYELQSQPITRTTARQWMLQDLERRFGVTAIAEKRLTRCYVMAAGPNIQKLFTKNGAPATSFNEENLSNYIINGKPEELTGILAMLLPKPVVDETGLASNIDIFFPKGFAQFTPGQIQSFLEKNGILLREAERQLEVPRLKSIITD